MTGHVEALALRGAGLVPAGCALVAPRPRARFGNAPAAVEAPAPEVHEVAADVSPATGAVPAPPTTAAPDGGAARPPVEASPAAVRPAPPRRVDDEPATRAYAHSTRGADAIAAAPRRHQAPDTGAPPSTPPPVVARTSMASATARRAAPVSSEGDPGPRAAWRPPDPEVPAPTPPRDATGEHAREDRPPAHARVPAPSPPHEPRREPPPTAVTIGRIDVIVEAPAPPPPPPGPDRTRGFASYARARRGALR
jgi:hypothetical protein